MNTVFVFSFGILLVIIYYLCDQSEDFRIRHYTRRPIKRHLRPRQLQQRVPVLQQRVPALQQRVPVLQQRVPALQQPQRLPQRAPQQGFPLGPAVNNPYQTGIVQGSILAPLQQQYRQIFTPRPQGMVSGQAQRQQHLAPGGLGHTGWVYRGNP